MKRSPFVAALFLCVVTFIHATRADDLKAMEGKWKVETAEVGGKVIDIEGLRNLVVTITGDHYELMTADGPDAGTLKLDETAKPKTMDATDTEGSDVGKVIKAIYEITGDTMRVCYAIEGGERPTELATKEGSPWLLVTYKREK
jgi:uncharacterized protein (TIGR03067 family)